MVLLGTARPIRIIIADDHVAMRQSMQQLLADIATITVVGQALNGQQALQLVDQLRPDVAILDAVMPIMDGIHAANRIRIAGYPTHVLIISVHESYPLARFALRQGAKGYVTKSALYHELAMAIETVYCGNEFISPALLDQSKRERDLAEAEEEQA
jgi:DNA-binding NarL/FixJ family response regulator